MSQGGHTITISRGAHTVDLTDLSARGVVEFDGFGMPPVRRLTQQGPMQNGSTDVGYRLDSRQIRIAVMMSAVGDQAIIDARAALMGILRPSDSALTLQWSYGSAVREIKTHYSGGMTLPSTDWTLKNHRAVFELYAPDPAWYDAFEQSAIFAREGGGSGFVFPLMVNSANISFGASNISSEYTISLSDPNAWITYPTIYITGPITNPIITNQLTGDKLSFTGNTITAGQVVTIDTAYGAKTVYNGATNWISKLSSDSALATFGRAEGDNSILVTGSSVDGSTSVEMRYRIRYIGV